MRILVLIILLFMSLATFAQAENVLIKKDMILKINDGDTFHVNIEGWPDIIGKNIGVRIRGIDTPDKPCVKKYEARAFLTKKLYNGSRIELKDIKRDKYFRILADVLIDDENVGAQLLEAGLAKPYNGGTKESW